MEKELMERLEKELENQIGTIVEDGFSFENLDRLGKLVDIHKDLSNEDYWKKKKEVMQMNYRDYGNEYDRESYGRRRRDSRGRYMGSGNRGGNRGGNYRGEEMLDEMIYHYGNYNEGKEMYGNDQDTMRSFQYMLKSFKDYYKHLKHEANSQEEVQMLEDTAREMLEM